MGHRKSIVRLGIEEYDSMAAYGQSKHADKRANGNKPMQNKIYSYQTMRNYKANGIRFLKWARAEYRCKTLEEARTHVAEYLQRGIDAHKSAWTTRAEAAALAKLYHCGTRDFGVDLPSRRRSDVKQHRTGAEKGHFSEKNNADLVALCKATGLRRHEAAALRPENVAQTADGRIQVHVVQGKGGKERTVTALNDAPLRLAQKASVEGRGTVIEHIPNYAPCHEYRREYAQELYERLARDTAALPRSEVYCCRKDRAGTHYDKAAMQVVSTALGHNRLDVVTAYLK